MGGAEEKDLHIVVPEGSVKGLQVHSVNPVFLPQGAAHQSAAGVADHPEEGVVYRGLEQDAVSRLGQGPDQMKQAGHHPGGGAQPAALQLGSVAGLFPGKDAVIIPVRNPIITKGPLVYRLAERLANALGRLEVHVRHPQGQQVLLAEVFRQRIPFDAVGVFPAEETDFLQKWGLHIGFLAHHFFKLYPTFPVDARDFGVSGKTLDRKPKPL